MGMLFNMDEEGKIEGNDWKAVPDWNILKEEEFRFVVLVWDTESPFRRMDVESREIRVGKSVLGAGAEKYIGSEKYKTAMWLYRAVDVDVELQLLEMYETKLATMVNMLRSMEMSDDLAIQKKYDSINKNVKEYTKQKNELQERINDRGRVKKNFKRELSGIEKMYERAKLMKTEGEVFKNQRAKV